MTKLPDKAYAPMLWASNSRISYLPRRNSNTERPAKEIKLPSWMAKMLNDLFIAAVREGRTQMKTEFRRLMDYE